MHQQVHRDPPPETSGWLQLGLALVFRALNPRVAIELLSLVWAFRALDWYRRLPFLPVPPRAYMRWRMYTAYGNEDAVPSARDVLRFARWRRQLFRG